MGPTQVLRPARLPAPLPCTQTLAYLLPVMTAALRSAESGQGQPWAPHALVLAPSQELAMQIMRVAQALLPREARALVQQCIGGANGARQREALVRHRPLLVVGTPGRVAELVRDAALPLHRCGVLVLDEVSTGRAAGCGSGPRLSWRGLGAWGSGRGRIARGSGCGLGLGAPEGCGGWNGAGRGSVGSFRGKGNG